MLICSKYRSECGASVMSTETIRLIRDREKKRGRGGGGGEGGRVWGVWRGGGGVYACRTGLIWTRVSF